MTIDQHSHGEASAGTADQAPGSHPPQVDAATGASRSPAAAPDPARALYGLLGSIRGRLLASLGTGAAGGIAGVVAIVLVGLAVQELFDTAPDPTVVFALLAGAFVGLVARFALRKWGFDISHIASFELETTLRRDLAQHLSTVPLGEVQRIGSGPLKKVLQDDVRALHGAVADATPLVGFGVGQPIAALVALAVIDWRLLLAVLAIAPLVMIGFRLVTKDYAAERRRYDAANEAINEAVVEFVQGMPVVRTFDDGTTSFRRFTTRVAEFTRATAAWQSTGLSAGVLTRAAMTSLPTLVIVMAVGTWLTIAGSLSPVDLAIAVMIGTMPVDSVVPLMYLSQFITESKAAAARIVEVLTIPPLPEPAHPQPPKDGSIRFTDVTFGYHRAGEAPGRLALDGVSLTIPAGTVCALVGPSGSGKSTVARLIPRFWDTDSGTVSVGGVDVRRIATQALLQHVSLVFQEPFLLSDSVLENIRLGRPDATDEQVYAAARAAQADEFIRNELPDGYATRVGERGGLLSGGQRQRITIARALLADAPVVVLDEATAFADPENEAAIQDAIAELTRGRTVVVIAHRLSTVSDADQIVVLDAGRIVEQGTHQELLAGAGLYERMWRHHENAREWGLTTGTASAETTVTSNMATGRSGGAGIGTGEAR